MPLYEYICLDCGTHFDALRSMRDADAVIPCEKCESKHVSRMLSLFNAQSGGRVIAGTSSSGCANCAGGTCAGCSH